MKPLLLLAGLLAVSLCQIVRADDTPPASAPAAAPAAAPASAAAAAGKSAETPPPVVAKPAPKSAVATRVRVVTSMGEFVIELNAERAPLTVANFLKYVDIGHYTKTLFHRVVPNFVIQGGGFDTGLKPVPSPYKVVNESGNGLVNNRGSVGMARGNDPHGADAQFFVNLSDNNALDPNQTRWGYAVFGKVTEGIEVVDRIANVVTGKMGPLKEDAPLKPVVIERIERISAP